MPTTDTNLGWALTSLLRDYLRQVDDRLEELPGGSRSYMMMSAIASDSCHSQVALAERLGLDRTTVTYLLDGLEGQDLVRRTPDPADRRVRHVNLTVQGNATLKRLARSVDEVEARVLARLSEAELSQFRGLLGKAAGLPPQADVTTMCQAAMEAKDYLEAR
ncbi:DNA-binding transcriptional regulator, MarR family [Devosia lucknowensis]|uniref:DNA-binding transcriptional regulator, MarR family n=1 Tax=Devosia lucknowensis TaxID=1096929 RepID=A0A1Y6FLT3_9HYPH|nr:MarR family transcriptional regulator [Devosia lucknowensis]SMQ75729.1 DNA-binding transcriptional regulator, MarR family [Devosia lucknowensis]